MKKIILASLMMVICFTLSACGAQNNSATEKDNVASEQNSEQVNNANQDTAKQIKITDTNGNEIIFALNDSQAAKDLYAQLPLEIDVKDYSDNEKIFYPKELNTKNTPLAENKIGTLAYYAPWKDVVMFYGEFRQNDQLFKLGEVVSGGEVIPNLSGKIKIEVFAK